MKKIIWYVNEAFDNRNQKFWLDQATQNENV